MRLLGSTTKRIRKVSRHRIIEVPERNGHLNEMLAGGSDVGDFWPLVAGLAIEDVVGLIEMDLYLYDRQHWLQDNMTVWVFEEKKGVQHVYTRQEDVPGELERAIRMAAAKGVTNAGQK